jgi:hypothetical protein
MEPPHRNPKQRPEALFALRHWSHLVLVQCDRLFQAAQAFGDVDHLPEQSFERDAARHMLLGEPFFLLCAGREMVRAINTLNMGKLPGTMHDELRHFRDALSHWNKWGDGERAELDIHKVYPDAWPYEVQVKDGDVLLGGSLKTSEVQHVVEQLYAWTRNPALGHPLVDVPVDPHTHGVVLDVRGERQQTEAVADALKDAGFVALVRNLWGRRDVMVLLTDPGLVTEVERVARATDASVAMERVFEVARDDDEDGED